MNVTGSAYGNSQLVAQFNYLTVVLHQFFVIFSLAVTNHEFVVGNGLYLQIIVEFRYLLYVLLVTDIKQRLEKFACFTGTSEDKAFTVLLEY